MFQIGHVSRLALIDVNNTVENRCCGINNNYFYFILANTFINN